MDKDTPVWVISWGSIGLSASDTGKIGARDALLPLFAKDEYRDEKNPVVGIDLVIFDIDCFLVPDV